MKHAFTDQLIKIDAGGVSLPGELHGPAPGHGLVIFVHGSGSSRHSPRNQAVAQTLRAAGLGTLLFDLLTHQEEIAEQETRHLRFDIGLLAARLVRVVRWLRQETDLTVPLGLFGASTGAAAALAASVKLPAMVGAIVSRGGRPDLAGPYLSQVTAPTLLIVGGLDTQVIGLNQLALSCLQCEKRMDIVPGASHLFEEPHTLDRAAALAAAWFQTHLSPSKYAGP